MKVTGVNIIQDRNYRNSKLSPFSFSSDPFGFQRENNISIDNIPGHELAEINKQNAH